MTKEEEFYDALKDIFVGAKIEGESGYINLMRIKSRYYEKGVFPKLQKDINEALEPFPEFREELFEKLYTFFSRYFSESGSIYFRYTPIHQNIYEKVYTDDKDVILFWKTHMLYYVKTDRLFKNLEVEIPRQASPDTPLQKGNTDSSPLIEGAGGVFKFFFDVSTLEHKKANEKREIIYEFKEKRDDGLIVFNVFYSERGRVTKTDEILKVLKKEGIEVTEEALENAFRVFEKQSEVDYFINKNAKEFLREQFNLWLYQYVFSGESEWTENRIKQLRVLKDIAFKIIDFISQFEDELVKIWNKPKFVLNSNYVITLDRIADKNIELIEKILEHDGFENQVTEWKELGIIDDEFDKSKILENSPSMKGCPPFPSLRRDKGVFSDRVVKWYKLPYNPNLKNKARELRKAGNLSEVLFWNQVKNRKFLGLDFDRQKIIGNYIVDFYCKDLGIIIEIDGITHDGKIEYDEQRDNYLKSLGLKVIHIPDLQVKNNLSGVLEFVKSEISKHTVPSDPFLNTPNPSIRGEFKYLPIDTKYFKDLEFEILSLFDDLDNSLDGWLIKSENYQALNTILPKFKEKVQTINEGDLVMDFFLGSGTTTAVAHKLGRKWIGVEMGEHFYTVVLPRMKKVLAYDKSGISKDLKTPRQTSSDTPLKEGNYQGGGFFKYYELEQYEDTLRRVKYEDSDLFDNPYQDPYNQYIFMRDLKMLEALEIGYENNKVKVDLSKLYPNIDIPETLSNLLGKWIKKITPDYVEFEDGEKINLKDLDYKMFKPLIWWR